MPLPPIPRRSEGCLEAGGELCSVPRPRAQGELSAQLPHERTELAVSPWGSLMGRPHRIIYRALTFNDYTEGTRACQQPFHLQTCQPTPPHTTPPLSQAGHQALGLGKGISFCS